MLQCTLIVVAAENRSEAKRRKEIGCSIILTYRKEHEYIDSSGVCQAGAVFMRLRGYVKTPRG